MAYLDQSDDNINEDLLTRKEFYWLKHWKHNPDPIMSNIIPRFVLDAEISKSGYLKLLGHQIFVENYFNPNTDYKRLHIKWSTGSGKTLGGLAIAMNFIKNYNIERDLGNQEIGSVFIIGFSERAFKNELLKYPEFGFLSREERIRLDKLKRLVAAGSSVDKDKYRDLSIRIKKRFSNRKGNGFFRFFGYKAFVNRIFVAPADINISEISEHEIRQLLEEKKIGINMKLLAEFKNSLIICDEIHNVYNSAEKNNWGIALQAVLDREPTVRFVSLSATPLNNNPAEIVDLLNLLLPQSMRINRHDLFDNDRELKQGALEKIAKLTRGRFSFLLDANPKYYPKIINVGESLKEIPYLKFIRCPMSPFHYKTYKEVYSGALSQDSQYLIDLALPNPENPEGIGIYQTNQIKKLLPIASQKFKDTYGIDYRGGKIVGDILLRKNIEKYSSKYAAVLDEIMKDIKAGNGKIFIYHNVVHMSGVLFIEQLLIKNGILDEFSSSSDNTICVKCGNPRKSHSKEEVTGGGIYDEKAISMYDEKNATVDQAPVIRYLVKNDKLIATAIDEGSHFRIPTQSKLLLAGEYLEDFDQFLNTLNKPVKITIYNSLGETLAEWLLKNGFTLEHHDGSHSTFIKTQFARNARAYGGGSLPPGKHRFMPVRFIMAHGEIEKAQMEHSIERFNSSDNTDGTNFLILVGAKIIKESYDIKSLQNEYIVSKPDNIPTLIQIRGRAVRKGSHFGLPPDRQVVRMKLFTSCLPVKQTSGPDAGKYQLSYEEEKYKDKIHSFQTIQKIERIIHENAIDAMINYERIKNNAIEDPLGPLDYEPQISGKHTVNRNKELTLDQLKLSTFNIYHAKKEVEIIKTLIKRLFIEYAGVWEYSDLLKMIRNPPPNYEPELNTALFSEENFMIALSHLIWNNSNQYVDPFIQKTKVVTGGNVDIHDNKTSVYDADDPLAYALSQLNNNESDVNYTGGNPKSNQPYNSGYSQGLDVVDHLLDPADKIIALPGGQENVIVPIPNGKKQFYILFPINKHTEAPDIDVEAPYRIVKQEEMKSIDINSFIQTKRVDFDYDDKKKIFYRKYAEIAVENMQNTVCEYGTTFHIKFVEECIEYVFRAWTDPNLEKHEYHEFYFKMLYYYDLLSLIMWAYTSKPRIFKEYVKYAIPVKARDIKLKAMARYEKREDTIEDINPDDNSDLATSGVINLLKSTFNRTSNAWIPEEFREQYRDTLEKSLDLFAGRKKKNKFITKTSADLLPIGHYISKFPKIFIPDKGWDENPTYLQNEQEYVENDLIVGFDERSTTGVHIRFKIRNPIHNIKQHKDSRQTEKGTVCKSKSKEYLKSVAKKLGAVLPDKVNVEELCSVIRSKLIRLELKERIKRSNIKYFYFFYEQRPETKQGLLS